nr:unnamed protein product [Haemonchus contortus]
MISSFYDLAFDISYLSIVHRDQISVQECSAIRNFVYNPIATQAFVDALERFLKAFFGHDIPLAEGSAIIAFVMYVAIWEKVRRIRKIDTTTTKPTSDGLSKMTTTFYYWNNNLVNVFFISCILPLVLAIPSTIFTILTEYNIYQNHVVNIIGVVILDTTTPITWILYILCIDHIRLSIIDCIRCRARQPRETSITKITLETF